MTGSGAEQVRIDGISDDENRLINRLLGDLHRLRQRNLLRTSYYENKRVLHLVGTLIPPQYARLGLVLGWTGKAVDALASRCNLEGFAWPDGDLGDIGGPQVIDENHLLSEVNAAILAALQHGPAFLVNTIGDPDDGEPRALIHVVDATEATGDWNRRRRALDNLLTVDRRDDEGQILSLSLYLDGETIVARRESRAHAWQVARMDHVYGVPAEVLPYKATPKRAFGQSRITQPMMALQDAAVRELARREGHMDVFSYPEFWLLGADESALSDGERRDVWRARLGRIRGIPDDADAGNSHLARADVKQFPAASPEAHWRDINGLAKLFAREAALPDSAVAISDMANPTSAESYDASQYELIAEAEGAVAGFSPAVQRAFVRALAMLNGVPIAEVPGEWRSIAPRWRNPRYTSRAAAADAGAKQLATVPWLADTEVGLELLGLTADQVRRALAERRRAEGRRVLERLVPPGAATRGEGE